MKYRIKQVGNLFYPQYKFLWFWWKEWDDSSYYNDGLQVYSPLYFLSIKDARNFLKDQIEEVKYHEL